MQISIFFANYASACLIEISWKAQSTSGNSRGKPEHYELSGYFYDDDHACHQAQMPSPILGCPSSTIER